MIIGKSRTNQPVEGGEEFEGALLESETSFENIVDKDGNSRFIEGNGEIVNVAEGISITYNHWSLSGTHLMLVVAGTITAGTTITLNSINVTYAIPEWIYNKIVPVISSYLLLTKANAYAYNGIAETFDYLVGKLDNPKKLEINTYASSAITTDDKGFRIQFDLLIDNE